MTTKAAATAAAAAAAAKPAREPKQPKPETIEATEQLKTLLESAKTARLSPAQEDEAAQQIKTLLAAGRAAFSDAVEAMLALPWNVGVSAVAAQWPEIKPTARKQLFAALAEQKSDNAKRLRLSLARGLFALDPEAAAQLAAETCAEMRGAEQQPLTQKDRQIFSNVLIGKGKPWLLHFPLADWKKEDAEQLVACAVESCFGGPCLPFTQITLLKWAAENGRLDSLPQPALDLISKAVKRWNPRLRKQLRVEAPKLPAPIAELVKPAQQIQPSAHPDEPAIAPESREEQQAPAENRGEFQSEKSEEISPETEPEKKPDEPEKSTPQLQRQQPQPSQTLRQQRPFAPQPQQQQQRRGARSASPREARATETGAFDLHQALRQIETHVAGLRRELFETQTVLRRRDEKSSQSRGAHHQPQHFARSAAPEISATEIDELRRHNARLEETVADLRQQLEELASDHEDLAAARGAHAAHDARESEQPPPEKNETEQFKTLLSIKLRDLFAEFKALRAEPLDDVIRQHFGEMLEEVFNVLAKQGVALSEPQ